MQKNKISDRKIEHDERYAFVVGGGYKYENGTYHLDAAGSFAQLSASDGIISSYTAELISATDYYAFGAPLPGRTWQGGEYRFGFNGQEKDDEVAGVGNIMTAEFWEYDARLGRRWNLDPVVYAWQSLYACFNNNPIFFLDPSGDEPTPDGKPINTNTSPTPWKVGSSNSSLSVPLKEALISSSRIASSSNNQLSNLISNTWKNATRSLKEAAIAADKVINFGILIVGQVSGDPSNARKPMEGMTIKTVASELLDIFGMSRKDIGLPFGWGKGKTRSLTEKRNQTEKPQTPNSGPVEGLGAPDQKQVDGKSKQQNDSIHRLEPDHAYHYFYSGKRDSTIEYRNGKQISKRIY